VVISLDRVSRVRWRRTLARKTSPIAEAASTTKTEARIPPAKATMPSNRAPEISWKAFGM